MKEEKKIKELHIMVGEEEMKEFMTASKKDNFFNFSEWVRKTLWDKVKEINRG